MYKILLSASLLLTPIGLIAQNASDYFHRGAQLYIWNKKQESKTEIFTGLQLFPDDPQLNGMAALLKKEEEQQQNQQNQSSKQDQNQQQQNQQNQQGSQDQRNQQQQQAQSQTNQQQQAQQPKPDKGDQQKQQAQAAKQDNKKENQEEKERQAAMAAGQMTPEQARQLLDAQKGEEMMLPLKPEGKPSEPNRPLKDW